MSEWISVKNHLPKNEQIVLVTVEHRAIGFPPYRKVVRAFYEDGTLTDADSGYTWEDTECTWDYYEYDGDSNIIIPQGWYEAVDYLENFAAIDDLVIGWMPLPEAMKG